MDNKKIFTLGLIAAIGSILTVASLNVQVSAWQHHTALNEYIIYALAIVPDIGFVVLAFFDYQIRTSGRNYNGIKFGVGVFIVVSLVLNISGSTTNAEAVLFGSFPIIIAMITHIGIGSLKVLNDGVSDFQLEVERKTKELTGFVLLMRDMMAQFEVVGDANNDQIKQLVEDKFNQVIDAIPQPAPPDFTPVFDNQAEMFGGVRDLTSLVKAQCERIEELNETVKGLQAVPVTAPKPPKKTMSPDERVEWLKDNDDAYINHLAGLAGLTASTIRRDLYKARNGVGK